MELRQIMKPWTGEPIKCDGLQEHIDYVNLSSNDLKDLPEYISIIDKEYNKKGELKKEKLVYLVDMDKRSLESKIFDYLSVGIVAIDKDNRIFFVNEMYSKILGVPISKVIGKNLKQIEPDATLLLAAKKHSRIELKRQFIKTIGKYVNGCVFPLYINGEFAGAMSVFEDATEIEQLSREVERANQLILDLTHQIEFEKRINEEAVIAKNPEYINMLYKASIAAKSDAPIMILGENGVGKEVIAKFVHRSSTRANKPLITVNCAAIPENLIESELFGYEGGAFTGARTGGSVGKFEMADGGTIFLDEIGDMPLTMQTKLLRVLQEKEIEKIGRNKNISVDVRIITATNQPLEEMMERKEFRQDLFYRINTVSLQVKPLRERKEDICILADYFLKSFNKQYKKETAFSEESLNYMLDYTWPGNVRELKNSIEYGVIMCQSGVIGKSLFPVQKNKEKEDVILYKENIAFSDSMSLKEVMEAAEKEFIQYVLSSCHNKTEAMERLGLSRRTFYRKLQEYNLK